MPSRIRATETISAEETRMALLKTDEWAPARAELLVKKRGRQEEELRYPQRWWRHLDRYDG
ncbi:hypothetical protein Pen02_26580 [Plantactinospora endophytica]|uniref:DUF899 domain-containing protein n=1 Tax=Plantactinospora endophytica TaxID=673535 RepID=A0ABQ4E062_9ACTN|nr:hypothetical protein Pen02_26580 [Plantactinospora endophytica]